MSNRVSFGRPVGPRTGQTRGVRSIGPWYTTTFQMPIPLAERLEEVSLSTGAPKAVIIRRALEKELALFLSTDATNGFYNETTDSADEASI